MTGFFHIKRLFPLRALRLAQSQWFGAGCLVAEAAPGYDLKFNQQ